MGKGKGRQAGGFGSKALRAAFMAEWQTRASEVPLRRPRKPKQQDKTSNKERPKLHLTQLRGLLQERQWHDRMEHQAERRRRQQQQQQLHQQARSVSSSSYSCDRHPASSVSPGWIVYFEDTSYRESDSSASIPSLTTLCLQALVPVLPRYLESLGSNQLHDLLSLLPGPTLTALSVLVSNQTDYSISDELVYVVSHHAHVKRLSLWGRVMMDDSHVYDEEEDESPACRGLTDQGLLSLLPSNHSFHLHVPDSWEQYDTDPVILRDDCFFRWQACLPLERLELGSLTHGSIYSSDAVLQLLQKCPSLTHLSLSGSLSYDSGPDVLLQLPEILPSLRVLDLSYCVWVTEGLLRRFWQTYDDDVELGGHDTSSGDVDTPKTIATSCHTRRPIVQALGCLTPTESVTLELEYPDHWWQEDRKVQQRRSSRACGRSSSSGAFRVCL